MYKKKSYLMSLKLIEDQVVDHKPSLLPASVLRGATVQVVADLSALVPGSHLPQY